MTNSFLLVINKKMCVSNTQDQAADGTSSVYNSVRNALVTLCHSMWFKNTHFKVKIILEKYSIISKKIVRAVALHSVKFQMVT